MKKALIIIGSLAAVGTGVYFFSKRPKAVININDSTGSGTFSLGNKQGSFNKTTAQGGVQTWNGYSLVVMGQKQGNSQSGSQGGYLLRRYGKVIEQTSDITPYDSGSSYVTINHI